MEKTFSEDNLKAFVGNLNEFGNKAKDLGNKVFTNLQNAMKPEETTATPAS